MSTNNPTISAPDRVPVSDVPSCERCRFWYRFCTGTGEHAYAECRAHPPSAQRVPTMDSPRLFPAVYDVVRTWPRPDGTDWCGEFEEAQPEG